MEKEEHQKVERDGYSDRNAKAQIELHASIQQEWEDEEEGQRGEDEMENRLGKIGDGLCFRLLPTHPENGQERSEG